MEGNRVVRVIGNIMDITGRKRAEEALLENEKFMDSVFESIQDGISVLNPDLSIRHVNGVMKKWYSKNAPLEGKKCFSCYRNADKPCDPCPTLRCLESGKTEMNIVEGLPDSGIEWIELYSYPVRHAKTGKITGVVEFVRDITPRMQAENALKESEDKYRNLVENINDVIYQVDDNGTVTSNSNYGFGRSNVFGYFFASNRQSQ